MPFEVVTQVPVEVQVPVGYTVDVPVNVEVYNPMPYTVVEYVEQRPVYDIVGYEQYAAGQEFIGGEANLSLIPI